MMQYTRSKGLGMPKEYVEHGLVIEMLNGDSVESIHISFDTAIKRARESADLLGVKKVKITLGKQLVYEYDVNRYGEKIFDRWN